MSRKIHRLPATRKLDDVDYRAYVWPCGCVTLGSRTGKLDRDCGDPACYRRTARPTRRVRL